MKTKICSKCKIDKPFEDYFKDNLRKIGIRCKCKACCSEETTDWREKNRSEYNNYAAMWRAKNPGRQHAMEIKRRYSMSVADYNALLVAQHCQCKICQRPHDPSVNRGRLYVDHCHKTNQVRGLLCSRCNIALGSLGDDPEVLKKAIIYLES